MRILLFICLVSFSLKGYNQDTVKTTLIVFDKEDVDAITKGKDGKSNVQKNALKINPLLYVKGELPIYYERALNDYLSVEAAIGMTFKDYSTGLFDDGDSFDEKPEEKINSHVSFKLGLRYYAGGVVMDGFYFALEFAKRDYTKELTFVHVDNIYDPQTYTYTNLTQTYHLTEYDNHKEFKLIVGSQEHYYWDNFFVDYYLGVGIDSYEKARVERDFDNITNLSTYKTIPTSSTKPRFYLGLKFGFMF